MSSSLPAAVCETIEVDVLIVGSGPSGTSTALHLIQRDAGWAKRILILEKSSHPREKVCGGGLTPNSLSLLEGLGFSPSDIGHFTASHAHFVSGNFKHKESVPVQIVCRDELDAWLASQCVKCGVDVREQQTVTDMTFFENWVEVCTKQGLTVRAKVVVAADGASSIVRRKAELTDTLTPSARLMEILTPVDPNDSSLFRENGLLIDYGIMREGIHGYYWDFPCYIAGKPFMNRGVFDNRLKRAVEKSETRNAEHLSASASRPLAHVLKEKLQERGIDLHAFELKAHSFRCFHEDAAISRERLVCVGDAAGADPLFGEGISQALGYGLVAAGEIEQAFAESDFSFSTYKAAFLNHPIGKNLKLRAQTARFFARNPWVGKIGIYNLMVKVAGPIVPRKGVAPDSPPPQIDRRAIALDFCRKILPKVSRTFAISVQQLPGITGEAVLVAYLIARIADTIEDDAKLKLETKSQLFQQLLRCFEVPGAASTFQFQARQLSGKEADCELATNATHVFRVFHSFPSETRRILATWCQEMALGMERFVSRYPQGIRIQTRQEYKEYCYVVAGTVGHLLTDLWFGEMRTSPALYIALKGKASAFGEALQTLNILKDVAWDSEKEQAIFVPNDLLQAYGSEHNRLFDESALESNRAALDDLKQQAHMGLCAAMDYLKSIPTSHYAARLFCLGPIVIGFATLRELRGSYAMLTPGGEVKITRAEVKNLMAACYVAAFHNAAAQRLADTALKSPFVFSWK